jgi:hypothetical protein
MAKTAILHNRGTPNTHELHLDQAALLEASESHHATMSLFDGMSSS